MDPRAEPMDRTTPESESYPKLVTTLATLLIGIVALGVTVSRRPAAPARAAAAEASKPPAPPATVSIGSPAPAPFVKPAPEPEPNPRIDREAIARAESRLDAASRDRERAEARAEDAGRRLAEATAGVAAAAGALRALPYQVRDPSAQLAAAAARGQFLRGERDRLKGELASLASQPRPKAKALIDKTPVARPAGGEEFHFELRRNRITFIDLERLLALVKSDAQLRIKLSDHARSVDSTVGPVGPFSLHYLLGRALPSGLDDLMERRGFSYDLRGWEIVPEFEGRGETYEAAIRPISEFARAIHRLSPGHATITMWVYPDGFELFRKLRDDLQSRGFMVAARPLPEGMAIRGSPAGSLSAGQ